jgi:hypothetical protein
MKFRVLLSTCLVVISMEVCEEPKVATFDIAAVGTEKVYKKTAEE